MSKAWRKKDWRKVRMPRHDTHLCIRWFHWSWRPRIYLCYWNSEMGEQRHMKIKLTKGV